MQMDSHFLWRLKCIVRHILSFTVMLSHIVTLGNTMIHLIRDIRNRSLEVVTLKFFVGGVSKDTFCPFCFLQSHMYL